MFGQHSKCTFTFQASTDFEVLGELFLDNAFQVHRFARKWSHSRSFQLKHVINLVLLVGQNQLSLQTGARDVTVKLGAGTGVRMTYDCGAFILRSVRQSVVGGSERLCNNLLRSEELRSVDLRLHRPIVARVVHDGDFLVDGLTHWRLELDLSLRANRNHCALNRKHANIVLSFHGNLNKSHHIVVLIVGKYSLGVF